MRSVFLYWTVRAQSQERSVATTWTLKCEQSTNVYENKGSNSEFPYVTQIDMHMRNAGGCNERSVVIKKKNKKNGDNSPRINSVNKTNHILKKKL